MLLATSLSSDNGEDGKNGQMRRQYTRMRAAFGSEERKEIQLFGRLRRVLEDNTSITMDIKGMG
jgi:hypothetical protein